MFESKAYLDNLYSLYTIGCLDTGQLSEKTEVLALFSCEEIPLQHLIQC